MQREKEKPPGRKLAAKDDIMQGANPATCNIHVYTSDVKPAYQFQPNNIPDALKAIPRWINWTYRWKGDKWDKPPVNPDKGYAVSPLDSANWMTFDDAARNVKPGKVDGIGFVFSDDDDLSGTDLDDCIDEQGNIASWAQVIIDELNSYTEISPSGQGVKIFCRGDFPHSGQKKPIEMYTSSRYFTVTGCHLEGTPKTVNRRPKQLAALNAKIFAKEETPPLAKMTSTPSAPVNIDDDELIRKAMGARNGDEFRRLWQGDWLRYPSQSEGDQALCNSLSWWTNHDGTRVDRLFRQSGLMRDKWDEIHHTANGRQTYGEKTIENADSYVSGGYTGLIVNTPAQDGKGGACEDDNGVNLSLVARIEQLEAMVRDLQAQLQREHDERLKLLAVQRNGAIKQERNTALAIIFNAESAKSRGMADENGWIKISRYAIAETTGISKRTVSEHTKRLTEWGIIEKDVREGQGKVINPTTGEIIEHPTEMWVKLTAPVPDLLDRLATIEPDRPKWGGNRPRCSKHPEAPIIQTTTYICAECGETVAPAKSRLVQPHEDIDLDEDPCDLRKGGANDARYSQRGNHMGGSVFKGSKFRRGLNGNVQHNT